MESITRVIAKSVLPQVDVEGNKLVPSKGSLITTRMRLQQFQKRLPTIVRKIKDVGIVKGWN